MICNRSNVSGTNQPPNKLMRSYEVVSGCSSGGRLHICRRIQAQGHVWAPQCGGGLERVYGDTGWNIKIVSFQNQQVTKNIGWHHLTPFS